ncbi:MAG TPA: DUF262 domain-containing protein [Acholeplasmataceae bacterium]|nr:DUF262 domain-containing protein [Acholeplasmataceae bacterium]
MERTPTVKPLLTFARPDKLNLKPSFQRGFIWKGNQMVCLIDSIIQGFDITPIYVWKNDPNNKKGKVSVIDGQQRLTTIIKFMNNEFPLKKNKCHSLPEELHGKRYQELPQEIIDKIQNYNLDVVEITGELEEIEEMFQRMQGGTKLKPVEVRNAKHGAGRDFVKSINDFTFFNVFRLSKEKLQHDEILHQIIALEINNLMPRSFRNQDLDKDKNFIAALKDGISEEMQNIISSTIQYLSEDAPVFEKDKEKLARINAVPLYVIARNNKEKIASFEFWKWATSFFTDRYPEAYKVSSSNSSADKENFAIRIELLQKDFDNYFNESEVKEIV